MPDAPHPADTLADIQQSFAEALPRIEGLASAYLKMPSSERKDEAIAEVVALSWKAYRELALQGRDVVKLLGKVVEYAARRVRSGGRLVGMQPVNDVMSATARFRHQYGINSLPLSETQETVPEVIAAMTVDTSPVDEAAFRLDLEAWLSTLDDRQQAIVGQLREGHNTVEVARLHRVSRMRFFQLRKGLIESWRASNGS